MRNNCGMNTGWAAVLAVFLLLPQPAFAGEAYTIDPDHSTIGFSVKHMMVSEVKGAFADYQGTISYDPQDLSATKIDVVIQAKSIDTRLPKRDEHLRNSDFLNTGEYPQITFVSQGINKTASNYVIVGALTIRGVTRTIAIPAQITGPVNSPFGGQLLGIVGETVINRQDFNVSWNQLMDSGGYVVGNDVNLIISVEAKR